MNLASSTNMVQAPAIKQREDGGYYGKNSEYFSAATALTVLGVVLFVLSLFLSWYQYISLEESSDDSYRESWEANYYLSEAKLTSKIDGESDTESVDWNDLDDNEISDALTTAKYIHIVTFIFSGLSLSAVISGGVLKQSGMTPKVVGLILAIVVILLSLVAPLYLAIQLPDAFEEEVGYDEDHRGPWSSFIGSRSKYQDETHYKDKWYPSWGWYFSLLGGIFIMIGGRYVYVGGKKDEKLPHTKTVLSHTQQPALLSQQINIAPNMANPYLQQGQQWGTPQLPQYTQIRPPPEGAAEVFACPQCHHEVKQEFHLCPFCGCPLQEGGRF